MPLAHFESRVARVFLDAGLQELDGNEKLFFNGADDLQLAQNKTVMNWGFKAINFTVRGSQRVQFEKLDLPTLFRRVTPVVYLYTPRTKRQVAAGLIERYGLPLKAEWFEDAPIPTDVGNSPDFTIGLMLQRTLFTNVVNELTSTLNVRVIQADSDLAEIFTNDVLESPKMPFTMLPGYKNTEVMTYGKDFTPNTEERFVGIRAIASSQDLYGQESPALERANHLIEVLSDRLGIPVTREADVDGALCVRNATFVYNGPTTGMASSDTFYDNVLVFDTVLDPMDSTARDYRGRCWIHYNNMI